MLQLSAPSVEFDVFLALGWHPNESYYDYMKSFVVNETEYEAGGVTIQLNIPSDYTKKKGNYYLGIRPANGM